MDKNKQFITSVDFDRLQQLVENISINSPIVGLLEDKLSQLDVVEPGEAPSDLITMNTEVTCRDESNHKNVRLVYPRNAGVDEGCVSIFAPLGIALLGSRVGSAISWRGNDGNQRSLFIDNILYQPEANGDWHL